MAHMKRVMVQFPESGLAEVDRVAGELGISRAELIRIAISHWTVCDDGEGSLRQRIANRVVGVTEEGTGA